MKISTRCPHFFGTLVAALLLGGIPGWQPARGEVPLAADQIGGKVLSARGAEAGVWVIAETQDFQTRFAKIVVTDEAGRFLLPALPKAKYSVWTRGYGLADSARVVPAHVPAPGFGVRGADIDRNGVVWISLASGHLGSSIGANAEDRSAGRPRWAITAPKAGASIACRDRDS